MKPAAKKYIPIISALIVLAITAVIFLYRANIIFVKYAEHGVLLGKTEGERNFIYDIMLEGKRCRFETKDKSMDIKPGVINFKYRKNTIVQFLNYVEPLEEKIMARSPASIELEYSGTMNTSANLYVYKMSGKDITLKSTGEIIVGSSNVKAYRDRKGNIKTAIIYGDTPLDFMRVGIKSGGFASFDHESLILSCSGTMAIKSKRENKQISVQPDMKVELIPSDGTISVYAEGSSSTFNDRVYIIPDDSESHIRLLSFKRGYGYPSYRGYFEITCTENKLRIINEVGLENYLYQVVPSEMPSSFGLEALKAQAVAARTYAISDLLSGRYASSGFHVDDSTMSQVYNNSPENPLTTRAVNETRGLVMKYKGVLIDAKYYSTSHGYGANPGEIWSSGGQFPGNNVPYLTAKSYLLDKIRYNLSSEEESYKFFKDWSILSYDLNSPYFRWKVTFTGQELENTIEKNLPIVYADQRDYILTLSGDKYESRPIPDDCLGDLQDLKVTMRGEGGNIMELVVEGSKGTYKIIKELNVRYVLRPRRSDTGLDRDIAIERIKSTPLVNNSLIPSAFMVFDIVRGSNRAIEYVTFYGGGYGHGVGMSQYGAGYLSSKGYSFSDILKTYYTGIDIESIY